MESTATWVHPHPLNKTASTECQPRLSNETEAVSPVADLRFERGVLDVAGWPVGTYVARIDGGRSMRFVVIE